MGSMGPTSPSLGAPLSGPTRSQQGTEGPDLPPACLTSPLAFQIHLFTHSVRSACAHLMPGTGDRAAKTEALLKQGPQPAGRGDRQRRKHTDERQGRCRTEPGRGGRLRGSLTPSDREGLGVPRLPSLSSGRGRSSELMRNAGTRCNEMHVSPQVQTGKQRARVREAAQGHSRGSQESPVETQGGGRGFGCECPGWGPRDHWPGRRGAGGTSGGLGTHTALHFRV